MRETITVTVTMYGSFRTYTGGRPLRLTVPAEATLHDVRLRLEDEIRNRTSKTSAIALLAASAFADEEQVLRDDMPVSDGASIAVLPPIAGG